MKHRMIYTLAFLFATMQAFAQSKTKYEYDANYRLTKVTYSSGIVVTYTYDALGNRLTKTVTGSFIKGDVNGDSYVNAADIVDLVAYLNNMSPDRFDEKAADANGDGDVNGDDIDAIAEIIMTTP